MEPLGCENTRAAILDFTDLEKKLTAVDEKMEETATLVSVCVRENAATVQAQDAYQEKYDRLTKRFVDEKSERKKLLNEMESRKARATELDKYIKTLKESGLTLNKWDDELWFVLVEKGVIQPDGSIVFTFKDGTEIAAVLQV